MRRGKEDREQRRAEEEKRERGGKEQIGREETNRQRKNAQPEKGNGKGHHIGTVGNSIQGSSGSRNSVVEDSIRNGETIRKEWRTFSERETRLKEECEKRDEQFYPEDDWAMPERQEEDRRRAEAKESQRGNTTRDMHSKRSREEGNGVHQEQMSGAQKKPARAGNGIAMRIGTINQKKGEKRRRKDQIWGSRNSRDQLVEAEKVRLGGLRKSEERDGVEENVANKKDMRHQERTTGKKTRRSRSKTQKTPERKTHLRKMPNTRAKRDEIIHLFVARLLVLPWGIPSCYPFKNVAFNSDFHF